MTGQARGRWTAGVLAGVLLAVEAVIIGGILAQYEVLAALVHELRAVADEIERARNGIPPKIDG